MFQMNESGSIISESAAGQRPDAEKLKEELLRVQIKI
jgi:hypothetical protein